MKKVGDFFEIGVGKPYKIRAEDSEKLSPNEEEDEDAETPNEEEDEDAEIPNEENPDEPDTSTDNMTV